LRREKEGTRWIPDFSGMTYGGEGKIKMWDGNAVMSNE